MQRLPNNTEAARTTGCLTTNVTGPLQFLSFYAKVSVLPKHEMHQVFQIQNSVKQTVTISMHIAFSSLGVPISAQNMLS
jgi:hypothetical protein